MHRLRHYALIAAFITSSALGTFTTSAAIAKTQSPVRTSSSSKIRWKPPAPPNTLGIPGNRAQGGGTRGCQMYRGITALVPKSTHQVAWGRTISDRPTIWINAPQGLDRGLQMEIAVRAEDGTPIAKQAFSTQQQISPGTIGITLPPETVLELDLNYQWSVGIYCDTAELIDRPFLLQGHIQRVAPPAALTGATSPLAIARILAANGIWYDALTQLSDRLRKSPNRQLANARAALLQAAGIPTRDRVRDCCQLDLEGNQ